jgi:hypothetical protein
MRCHWFIAVKKKVFIVHTCKEEEEEEAAKKNLVLRSQYFLPQTLLSLSLSLS